MNAEHLHRGAVGRLGLSVVILVAAAIALAGCGSNKWTKPGATPDQRATDERRCTREFLTPGAGGAVRNYAIDPDCMRKLGYERE